MKKGKYIDYTCLIACLSHNKRDASAINQLVEQVEAGENLNERLLLAEKSINLYPLATDMVN